MPRISQLAKTQQSAKAVDRTRCRESRRSVAPCDRLLLKLTANRPRCPGKFMPWLCNSGGEPGPARRSARTPSGIHCRWRVFYNRKYGRAEDIAEIGRADQSSRI